MSTQLPAVRPLPIRGALVLRPVLACLLAITFLFAIDSLLFRTPLYLSRLEPGSSTGTFEQILQREQQAQLRNGSNLVATVGDSRFAYAPRLSNQLTGSTGLVFRHAGMGGTNVRDWYYMLRDLDPTAQRYRALVFGVVNFYDEDEYFSPPDDIRSLYYEIARLRWSDTAQFTSSFEDREVRWKVLRGVMLHGIVLQNDIFDFLSSPLKRQKAVAQARENYEMWTYGYLETDRSMAGLRIDWSTRAVSFPSGLNPDQIDTVKSQTGEAAPQTGRFSRYRRLWFERILDRYRNSPTRIIFLRLPRGPVPRPNSQALTSRSVIRSFAARPNVLLLDEHFFDTLEHPELFRDGLHLNREGIARFSPMLAVEIARVLSR